MVRAWYIDDREQDSGKNQNTPPQFLKVEDITTLTGVLHWDLSNDLQADETVGKLKADRGYHYEDTVEICKGKMEDYEEKMKGYAREHLHLDEEIRHILDGGVYFDVRDKDDKWIRIHATKGDLLIIPPGLNHRLAHDTYEYVKARRLFKKEPTWSSINRTEQ